MTLDGLPNILSMPWGAPFQTYPCSRKIKLNKKDELIDQPGVTKLSRQQQMGKIEKKNGCLI